MIHPIFVRLVPSGFCLSINPHFLDKPTYISTSLYHLILIKSFIIITYWMILYYLYFLTEHKLHEGWEAQVLKTQRITQNIYLGNSVMKSRLFLLRVDLETKCWLLYSSCLVTYLTSMRGMSDLCHTKELWKECKKGYLQMLIYSFPSTWITSSGLMHGLNHPFILCVSI